MSLFNKDTEFYEDEIKELKKAHFRKIAELEDKVHTQEFEIKQLKQDMELKLKKQEMEYEQKILALHGQLKVEKELLEVKRKESVLNAEKEIAVAREEFKDEKYDEMVALLDREKNTLHNILEATLPRLPKEMHFDTQITTKQLAAPEKKSK